MLLFEVHFALSSQKRLPNINVINIIIIQIPTAIKYIVIGRSSPMSDIQSLTAKAEALQKSFDFWNNGYVILVAITVILAAIVFFTQFMSIKRGKELAKVQSDLLTAKDKQLALDLKDKDLKIEEAKEKASKADGLAVKAKLETEKLREKNISLEMAVSPRILEQHLTGEALKSFAGVEVAVISLPDFEPRRTAGQIRWMLLSEAKWKRYSGSLPHIAFFDGVVVHTFINQQTREAAEALVSVLKNNGIEARTGYPIRELGKNGILVVVGPKPLPKELQLKPEDVPSDEHGNRIWGNILEE